MHVNQISAFLTSQACSSSSRIIPCTEQVHGESGPAVCAWQGCTQLMKEGTQGPLCLQKPDHRGLRARGPGSFILLLSHKKAAVLLHSQKAAEFLGIGKISCEMTEKKLIVYPKGKNRGVLIQCVYRLTGSSTWQGLFLL